MGCDCQDPNHAVEYLTVSPVNACRHCIGVIDAENSTALTEFIDSRLRKYGMCYAVYDRKLGMVQLFDTDEEYEAAMSASERPASDFVVAFVDRQLWANDLHSLARRIAAALEASTAG
jgi:hypothetical protein